VAPTLRVALVVAARRVAIAGQGDVLAALDGRPEFRVPEGQTLVLSADGTGFVVEGGVGGRYERLSFASLSGSRYLTVDGRSYRGTLEAFVRRGVVTVVNAIGIEAYLGGVVNAELGRRAATERAAVEAQAIVSRTYALRNRGRFAAEGYDLQAGVADQVYGGVESETPLGLEAVRATAGMVLAHDGNLIVPFFHSTCGGRTATPEEAFVGVRPLPYLEVVRDERPDGSAWCDGSPRFRWSVEWEGAALRAILGRTLPAALGVDAAAVSDVREVYVRRRGASGRATDVRIRVASGEVPVPAHAIRTVFETPEGRPLGSTAVEFEGAPGSESLARLVARGSGWGHGVGMCQWGAVGRARGGQDHRTIVNAYFPGTTLARWY
jgi:stage II sporulation protein D